MPAKEDKKNQFSFFDLKKLLQENQKIYQKKIQILVSKILFLKNKLTEQKNLKEEVSHLLKQLQKTKETIKNQENTPKIFSQEREKNLLQALTFLQKKQKEDQIELSALKEELWQLQEIVSSKNKENQSTTETLFPLPKKVDPLEEKGEEKTDSEKLEETKISLEKILDEKEVLQTYYDHLKDEFIELEEDLFKSVENRNLAENRWKEREKLFHEKEEEIENLKSVLSSLEKEKNLLEEALLNHDKEIEEKENRMKTAQQHLAKKVKENAIFSEELEKKEFLLREFEQQKKHLENKNMDLQKAIKEQQEQNTRTQQHFHQMLQTLENQLNRKDEKYFQIFDKYKKLEEKQQQMQNVFSNLGHLMKTTQEKNRMAIEEALIFETEKNEEKQERNVSFFQENSLDLFLDDVPKTKISETLFDEGK